MESNNIYDPYNQEKSTQNDNKKRKTVVMDRGIFIGIIIMIVIISMLSSFLICDRLFYNGTLFTSQNKVAFVGEEVDEYKLQKLQTIINLINENYCLDYSMNDLIEGAIQGLVYALGDPYTNYLEPGYLESYMNYLTGTYAGVGITYQVADNGFMIVSVVEESPAAEAGIVAGDIITHINDKSALEYDNEMLSEALSVDGATSTLTVIKAADNATVNVQVTARQINVTSVYTGDFGDGIKYIRITQFDDDTGTEFKAAVNKIQETECKGLILDLRNNGGGYEKEAAIVADTILPEGTIAYCEDKKGNVLDTVYSDANELTMPIVLLVNQNSASASEYVTGAFKDHNKGTIIGVKTFGKALGQVTYQFDGDDSGLTLTIARYFTPSGKCIHGEGITPDIVIELSDEYKNSAVTDIPFEQDTQLQKAIEELKK
ncbi:MAG: S41 family peptidase [Ruminococcaceae bacterium]|nr:S41 family peptidase [Oscillospiraceae bacterium]